jgi:hypothetical protein
MKPLRIVIATLLLVCGSLFAAEPPRKVWEGAEHPKDGFASVDALRTFAETSSFGGGFLTAHRLADRDVYVVSRCFTSGVPTTELSIYLKHPEAATFYCALFQPLRGVELRSKVAGDAIVFEQYDYGRRGWVIAMTVTRHFLDR